MATGTSPGICTVDSSESSPPESSVGTGRPDYRQRGVRGDHSGQVGGPACGGDDDPYTPSGRHRGVLAHNLGRSVGAHHVDFMGHPEFIERGGGRLDLRPIAVATHYDAHQGRGSFWHEVLVVGGGSCTTIPRFSIFPIGAAVQLPPQQAIVYRSN